MHPQHHLLRRNRHSVSAGSLARGRPGICGQNSLTCRHLLFGVGVSSAGSAACTNSRSRSSPHRCAASSTSRSLPSRRARPRLAARRGCPPPILSVLADTVDCHAHRRGSFGDGADFWRSQSSSSSRRKSTRRPIRVTPGRRHVPPARTRPCRLFAGSGDLRRREEEA